jgi:hypothetical protein
MSSRQLGGLICAAPEIKNAVNVADQDVKAAEYAVPLYLVDDSLTCLLVSRLSKPIAFVLYIHLLQ